MDKDQNLPIKIFQNKNSSGKPLLFRFSNNKPQSPHITKTRGKNLLPKKFNWSSQNSYSRSNSHNSQNRNNEIINQIQTKVFFSNYKRNLSYSNHRQKNYSND